MLFISLPPVSLPPPFPAPSLPVSPILPPYLFPLPIPPLPHPSLSPVPVSVSLSPSQMGRFLGELDGALMTQLLSMGVFSQ